MASKTVIFQSLLSTISKPSRLAASRDYQRPQRTEGSAKMRFQQFIGVEMLVLLVRLGLLVVGLQYVPHHW